MRLTQTLKQKPTVSPQLVLANELLQLSSLELEQAIARELAENPALEVCQVQQCPVCGADLSDGVCSACGAAEYQIRETWRDRSDPFQDEVSSFTANGAADEWSDPVSRLAANTTLTEHLLRQARLSLTADDLAIACHLVGCLDDRGWLSCGVQQAASDLNVDREHVEEVLTVVQSLEPVGVAARDARECLLLQIADLGGEDSVFHDSAERSLAECLIRDQWDRLGRASLPSLAREVDASIEEVRGALHFIRENLNPFPGHGFWAGPRGATTMDDASCPQPDVIIHELDMAEGRYDIELPKAGSYDLRVRRSYRRAMDDKSRHRSSENDSGSSGSQGWELWEELCGRARLFLRSIEQRWETLHNLMRCLIDYQRDFLIHGEQSLRPLTRAQVAEMMGVHEATVSRAVAGKYVELPGGEVVPLETFFDSAAPLKHLIEELIDHEETSLSDRAIAERLGEEGYDVARRTVAKYRNALSILPSSLRRWSKEI